VWRASFTVLLIGTILLGSCSNRKDYSGDGEPNLITFSRIHEAWELSTGRGVKVAILDWQFDMSGKEAEKYVNAVSMVPDDEIGDLKPWHGEWMAEIVHTIAPEAAIIPIRARRFADRHYEEYAIAGIRYAADHGAAVVTNSMGELHQSDDLLAAIDYAETRGTIFVDVHPEIVQEEDQRKYCGVGQCDERIIHTGIVSVPDHPARPKENRDLYTWPYDLEAHWKDGWGYSNGPPTVAGVIALMVSVNENLSPGEIRRILIETADMHDGFNVLNAYRAVSSAAALRRGR